MQKSGFNKLAWLSSIPHESSNWMCTIHVHLKVDTSSSKTMIIWTPIFEWYVIRCGSKNKHQFQRDTNLDWIMCSKYANHSRFSSQHDFLFFILCWESGNYWHLMSWGIFTLVIEKISIWAVKKREINGYEHNLDTLIVSAHNACSYPTRSGCKEKNIQTTLVYSWGAS
jgi:hypothetical protein